MNRRREADIVVLLQKDAGIHVARRSTVLSVPETHFVVSLGELRMVISTDPPVGRYLAGEPARPAAGLIQQFLQRRPRSPRSARGSPLEVQRVGVGQRLRRAEQNQGVHAVGRADAQRRRAGEEEPAPVVCGVGELVLGVVARVEQRALAVAIDVQNVDPALLDHPVGGLQGHLQHVALPHRRIRGQRRIAGRRDEGQGVVVGGGGSGGAVCQLEPAMDLRQPRGERAQRRSAIPLDVLPARRHPVAAHRIWRRRRTTGAVVGTTGTRRSGRQRALVEPGVSRPVRGQHAGQRVVSVGQSGCALDGAVGIAPKERRRQLSRRREVDPQFRSGGKMRRQCARGQSRAQAKGGRRAALLQRPLRAVPTEEMGPRVLSRVGHGGDAGSFDLRGRGADLRHGRDSRASARRGAEPTPPGSTSSIRRSHREPPWLRRG